MAIFTINRFISTPTTAYMACWVMLLCGNFGRLTSTVSYAVEDDQLNAKSRHMAERPRLERENWGNVEGRQVHRYTLENCNGTVCKLTNWGATLTELHVRDHLGELADVVLGFENLDSYLNREGQGGPNPGYMGCTIGRYCNRIRDGRFELGGTSYQLSRNNDPNHLHGGTQGWDKRVWEGTACEHQDGPAVRFTLISPNGDENYPGKVRAEVVYVLTEDDSLRIEFSATTDKPTPLSMTNHTYFNLAGEGSGSVLDHRLKLVTDNYVVCDTFGIPTGEIRPTKGTAWDFKHLRLVGERLNELNGNPGGYEINCILRNEKTNIPELAATLFHPASGRVLELLTTEVGLIFYSGNYLDGSLRGKSGKPYEKHFGLCLEPQFHPDSPNRPQFPSSILLPGKTYRQVIVYRFRLR